jgi:hypothetical protein
MATSNRVLDRTAAALGLAAALVLATATGALARDQGGGSGAASGASAAAAPAPAPSGALGASALRARYDSLGDRLTNNPFGKPLVLDTSEGNDRLLGEVYGRIDQPFSKVAGSIQTAADWCSILILHLNVKRCHAQADSLDMALGRKYSQPADEAYKLHFAFHLYNSTPAYYKAGLTAPDGPLGTRDYLIELEAVPLDAKRTILHMSYAYGVGTAAKLGTSVYLSTTGADKVGFEVVGKTADGQPQYVGGVQGLTERNTMRYYLAIEAYVNAPGADQLDKRMSDWFDATERYPRQLHEVDKAPYIAMKREEAKR